MKALLLKICILGAFAFLFLSQLSAQADTMRPVWLRGGSYSNIPFARLIYCTKADNRGNTIIIAYYKGDSVRFGNVTIHARTSYSNKFCIVAYDSAGNVLWGHDLGWVAGQQGYSYPKLAIDIYNNVYCSGSTYLDTTLQQSVAVLMKYDAAGQWLWSDTAGISKWATYRDIQIDNNGNILVAGYCRDSVIAFGHDTIRQNDVLFKGFIAKYMPSGQVMGIQRRFVSRNNLSFPYGLALADNGDEIISFYTTDTFRLDTFVVPAHNTGINIAAKIDSGGAVKWVKKIGGGNSTNPVIDHLNNVYFSVAAFDSVSIGDQWFSFHNTNRAHRIFFLVAKLDPAGNIVWTGTGQMSRANTGGGYINALMIAKNDLYVNGCSIDTLIWQNDTLYTHPTYKHGSAFILSLNKDSGSIKCTALIPASFITAIGGSNDNGSISISPQGILCAILTSLDSVFTLGGDTLHSRYNTYASYLARFTPCTEPVTISGVTDMAGMDTHLVFYPNPTTGEGTVSYTIPEGSKDASIIITDLLGRERLLYPISTSATEKQVHAQGLGSGIYFCALVADGHRLAIRKIVIE